MTLELINVDGTTTALHREPRIIDGFSIPLPEEIDSNRPVHALALQHARVFKTLFGLHGVGVPKPPSDAVVDAYEEILLSLIQRKVPIAFTGVPLPWDKPIHARTVNAWHRKAMSGLITGPRRKKWPALIHRMLLAYSCAGYLDPNKSRLNSQGYASEAPLHLALESNNHWGAAALIELGASTAGYPAKEWVVNNQYVKNMLVKAGDLGGHLDAYCPRGLPERAAIDQALMERAIRDHQTPPQADRPSRVVTTPRAVAPVPEVVITAAPLRRRGL